VGDMHLMRFFVKIQPILKVLESPDEKNNC
jgi:hypothetical protein